MRKGIWYILALLLVGLVAYLIFNSSRGNKSNYNNPVQLPGLLTGQAPWPANQENLADRLKAIGLPALRQEGTKLHTHQHLDIVIHGQGISVPAGIGVDRNEKFISPIHIHEDDQIIHVESPVVKTFTLGQFFDVWGVRFSTECIGGYCQDDQNRLQVYSNGQLITGDPRNLALEAHQQITVIYGKTDETPPSIPSKYNFPPGL